jgi:hypothetical protein
VHHQTLASRIQRRAYRGIAGRPLYQVPEPKIEVSPWEQGLVSGAYRAPGRLFAKYRSYDPLWRLRARDHHAIASWLEMLKREKGAIVSAGAHAHGAVDFLHGFAAARKRCRLISGLSLWQ